MRLTLVFASLLTTALAYAQQPVELVLKNQVPQGQKPTLTVKATQIISGGELSITREEDKKHFSIPVGALKPGQAKVLAIGDGHAGVAHWKGALTLRLADGNPFTNEVTFESGTTGSLKVTYDKDHVDLKKHTLEFQLSQPAGHADIAVFGEDGAKLATGEATYHGEPAGTWLKIEWSGKEGNVMRLELRAFDRNEVGTLVKLYPWSVPIQHEEVVFESGKADIRPSEEAKLDASYQKIIDALEKVRKSEPSMKVRLYIAGHTDTVGSSDDNRKLSLARARAIAVFYRTRGLPISVAFAGFGEDAPRVKTPDNTDEPRNRRADYILALEPPLHADWRELK